MTRLTSSIVAFSASTVALLITAWLFLVAGIADAGRSVVRAIDFVLVRLGYPSSVAPDTTSNFLGLLVLVLALISASCFWWLVRELALRYPPNQVSGAANNVARKSPTYAGAKIRREQEQASVIEPI